MAYPSGWLSNPKQRLNGQEMVRHVLFLFRDSYSLDAKISRQPGFEQNCKNESLLSHKNVDDSPGLNISVCIDWIRSTVHELADETNGRLDSANWFDFHAEGTNPVTSWRLWRKFKMRTTSTGSMTQSYDSSVWLIWTVTVASYIDHVSRLVWFCSRRPDSQMNIVKPVVDLIH